MDILKDILPYIVTIVTTILAWFGGRRKTAAEVEAMEVATDTVEATNAEKLLKINSEFIVEPLKKEINGLRKEIKKLRGAIDTISDCAHYDSCPVRDRLQKHEGDKQ